MALDLPTVAGADGQQALPDLLVTGVLIWRLNILFAGGDVR